MMLSFGEAMRVAGAGVELLRERLQSGVSYNPLSSRTAQDPYPVYAALRTRGPVHRSRLLKAWLFTRHADVDAILRDHRHFGNDPRTGTLSSRQHAMLPPADEFTMLFLDPPDHTRLRALVNKAFTRKAVDDLEPRIRGILETLLDDIEDLAGFDLMQAVARPLPVIVIAEMLGVPPQDRERFRIWSAQRARLLEPMIGPREREAGEAASRAFDAYFRPIIEARRAEPRDDIVSALARAEDEGARLSERETLNMLRLLLSAGNETTVNLIGNGMLALLRHPEQLQRLRNDPSLIPAAVEELLRFDSPDTGRFPARARRLRGERVCTARHATTWSCFSARPTGIRTSSRIPTALMSDAARAPTCRSDAASTIVSAVRSRAWKVESLSRCCSSGSRR